LGFQKERSILLIHCISLVLCCIGYLCLKLSVIIANIIFVLVLLGFVGLYFILGEKYFTMDYRSKDV
jgi:ABC-type siderophore export system fused ATPase/permease subunit